MRYVRLNDLKNITFKDSIFQIIDPIELKFWACKLDNFN